jgi:Tfp pilus assembly protein PilP
MKSYPASVAVCVVAGVVAIAGCGESAADKAKKQVCAARSDIKHHVTTLQNMDASSATPAAIKDSLTAIRDDVAKVVDAQPKLNAQQKEDVQAANQAFKASLQKTTADLKQTRSAPQAKQQVHSAAQQLVSSYQSSLGKISCP